MAPPERLAVDVDRLRAVGYRVRVVESTPRYYVIIEALEAPAYAPAVVDELMVMADYQYNQSPLDMFWTIPTLRCKSGTLPRNADQFENHDGRMWQRWSYHYPWKPTKHDLSTHIEVVRQRLADGS